VWQNDDDEWVEIEDPDALTSEIKPKPTQNSKKRGRSIALLYSDERLPMVSGSRTNIGTLMSRQKVMNNQR
jgi:hypothetical protein